MKSIDSARNGGSPRTWNNEGAFLTVTATAIVYLAPWGSETGTILASLWTVLLAFCLIDRSLVRPYLYPAALSVLLVFPALQASAARPIDPNVAVESENSMSHTASSRSITLDQLTRRMDQPEEGGHGASGSTILTTVPGGSGSTTWTVPDGQRTSRRALV